MSAPPKRRPMFSWSRVRTSWQNPMRPPEYRPRGTIKRFKARATTPSPSMAASSRSQRWCRELYIMSFMSFLLVRRSRRPRPRPGAPEGGRGGPFFLKCWL